MGSPTANETVWPGRVMRQLTVKVATDQSVSTSPSSGAMPSFGQFDGPRHVFPYHVAFEVDAIANLRATQIRVLHRVRHDLHVEAIGAELGDRQADAVHRNRSLVHHERREPAWKRHGQPVKVRFGAKAFYQSDAIDVPLHEVTAESAIRTQRPFEIHARADRKRTQRRDANGFRSDVR